MIELNAPAYIAFGSTCNIINVGVPKIYPQLNVIQKGMVVDSSPKLTHNDWIKEQSKDLDINHIIQLLKSNRLKKYVA